MSRWQSKIYYRWVLLVLLVVSRQGGAQEINHQAMNLGAPLTVDALQAPVDLWSHDKIYPTPMSSIGFNDMHYHRAIAAWSLQQVNATLPQVQDPWVMDTVYRISAQMNAQVRTQPLLAVPVINDRSINAFAVPGGLIAINSGTILAAQSLDESAGVLAHEIAHLSQRHYERRQDTKGQLMALQLGGLLAALAAASVSGDAATALLVGAQTMAADSAAAHSRAHEREADRLGMQIMVQAGFSAYAMPRFFERLARQTQLNQAQDVFIPSFVRSHPFALERLSEAHSRAAAYPTPKQQETDVHARTFDLLKWRMRYLMHDVDLTALAAAAKHSTGAKLALLAQLADLQRFDEAEALWQQLAALPASWRDEVLFCVSHAHIAYARGDFAKAVEILSPCQRIYPERRDLRLYLADALIYAGDAPTAATLLMPLLRHDHDVVAWDLYQRAHEHYPKHDIQAQVQVLRARAKKELWHAKYHDSLISLAAAYDLAKDANYPVLMNTLEKDRHAVQAAQAFKP